MVNKNGGPDEHLSFDGKVRPCEASSVDACRAGSNGERAAIPIPDGLDEDYKTRWAEQMNKLMSGKDHNAGMRKKPYVDTKPSDVGDFNDSPINKYTANSYVFVDIESGSVIPADSAFVIEQPMFNSTDEHEEFLNNPNDFVSADAKYVYEVIDLSEFSDPLLVDLDSGLILQAASVKAVDIDDGVDVDELFENFDYQQEIIDSIGFDHFRR